MSAIRRHSFQLSLLTFFILAAGIFLTFRCVVRAQDSGVAGLSDIDIGTTLAAGGAQNGENNSYTLISAGTNIWGQVDSFNYLYQTLGTNGQIIAHVAEMQGNSAVAGVMIRETLDASSRNAAMLIVAGQGSRFQWRLTTNGSELTPGEVNETAPFWVKIVRSGDWIGGYGSSDGTNWTLVGWQSFPGFAQQANIGLVVASGNHQGLSGAAVFDQVGVGSADLSQAVLPVVGEGDGLLAEYYDNRALYGMPVMSRVEPGINIGYLNALQSMQAVSGETNAQVFAAYCKSLLGMAKAEDFGVRWSGEVQAQFSEPYTFFMRSDDGARIWLNEQLILDDWHCHPATNRVASATVNLVAGQRYLLRVEYFQNLDDAQAHLSWSSPSTTLRSIPQSQLYSQPTMDLSGNGLPIYWEEHYFGQTNVDPNADPDGDGLSTLQEYRLHTDPTNPQTRGVPDTWGTADVGDGLTVGDAHCTNKLFTITSDGTDIARGFDEFHYVFQGFGTNEEMIARVVGIQASNCFAKAGIMVRESLDPDARNAAMLLTLEGKSFFEWRPVAAAASVQTAGTTNASTPFWVKIVRGGDWVGGYESPDGTNWTMVDWVLFKDLPTQAYVGLVVTAHDGSKPPGGAGTARFDQVSLGPANPSDVMNVPEGNGDGLMGNYRNDSLLYLPPLTNRVDSWVAFDWPHQTPLQLNPDSYGVCWSGEVQPQFTGPYTFSLQTRQNDWVRMWINDHLVVNQWRTLHRAGDFKGIPVNLVAGQHYLIRIEMFNNQGFGQAFLRWSCPGMTERSVPQSQLYSQPEMDPDGSGLPVIWEQIYFGHTGVDPNGDPDQDGLSNLQEWQYHTNPTNSDTDGDGLPDPWEIANGLDPQYPNDAGMDYDNSGLSNLQDYELGLNPFNADVNNDGLPDWFEEEYLGTGTSLVCTNQISVALAVNGAQATNFLGQWQVDGTDIYCLDRRGGLDFPLSINTSDKYVLNLIGTQNQNNPLQTSFKLLLAVDNQTLGHYILNAGYGTNGTVELVLPYLQAGSHVFHVFWDGYASYSSLRIRKVKLLSVSGSTNQAGIKEWAAQMIADQSGMDNTNPVISSYTSPFCLEGRDPFPLMMAMTNCQTNVLSATGTSDGHWYVNVPLSAGTQTVFQASYQNGALSQDANIQWLPVNLLSATNLTIRQGDSLLFNAQPTNGGNGRLQVAIGTNTWSGTTAWPVPYQFATPGTYTVTGAYTSPASQTQNGSVTVDVVPRRQLPRVDPDAWTGMERALNLTNFSSAAVLQADSRLTCLVSGTNGGLQLNLGADANEPRSILARLGANGPILDSTQVQGFDVWSGNQAYTKTIQVYPDGSQLVEMLIISSPVETNVTFVIQPIVSGVMYDDGTTLKVLTATNFDALGQCPVRFIRPASATSSVCNQITGYQGNYQIGYRR